MVIDNAMIVEAIMPHVEWFKILAQEFAKSRFLVNASEFGMNEKESAELMKIADGINIGLSNEGSSISLKITYGESPYLDIVQEGMDAPEIGGSGGTVTNPDNSTEQSQAPQQLWGTPLPNYAKQGEDVMGEVKDMLTSLFKDAVVQAAGSAKADIANIIKPELIKEVQAAVGGVA